jgi:hypothetical protein
MDRGTENFKSPLDEVLEGLPEEQPPADLKDRCIAALDVPTARVVRPAWMQVMRNVAAAAAVLMLVAGVYNVGIAPSFTRAREKSRQTVSDSPAREMHSAQSAMMAEEPEEPRPEVVTGLVAGSRPRVVSRLGLEPSAAPEAPPYLRDGVVSVYQTERAGDETATRHSAWNDELTETLRDPTVREISIRGPEGEADETTTRYSAYEDAAAQAPGAPEDVVLIRGRVSATSLPGDDRVMRSVTEGETDAWRDLSGERQVSYHKEMELEVAEVEQAHQRVREIVSKRGGYIASDQVRIQEDSPDSARLTIRLPIDAYEDAIEDLKELGEVVRLVGESVDRTHEYYTRGAEVREMADREADLLRRYEAETNAQKKRRLKQQLDALRAQLPVLELTLTEAVGPSAWMSRSLENSVNALAWVGATAVIWLPAVVIVTLFWRRRTS